jgi:hypothetical protein
MGQFGVMLMDEAISIEPVYDETPDVASGWVMDVALKLKHSNCITPLGEITFTVPGTSNISLRYLTCDTLNNCASFNEAIDNLQEQIDNIIAGEICGVLEDCEVIQDIQTDILSLSGDTINIQQDITDIQQDILTLSGDTINIQQDIVNIQQDITNITTGQTQFYIAVNYESAIQFTYVAPENFRIDSITNPSNLTLTTTVNNVTYTLGNQINLFDTLRITPNTTGFIKLNCTLL